MGITGLYMGPIFDFGGGAWGYNQSDLHKVQGSYVAQNWNKFNGWDDYVKLAKTCRQRNMKLGVDWIPGQIYGDNNSGGTISRNQKMWFGERFGGRRILQYVANTRQFFVDHSQFLYSLGTAFFRVDNPKFYPDPLEQGLPFFCYTRSYCDKFAPDLYTFGEVPGNEGECAAFSADGNRLHGMLDFPLRSTIQWWCSGGSNASLEGFLTSSAATYGNLAVMTGFYENHDHDRVYHTTGDNMSWSPWNMQKMFLFLAAHTGPPVIFYGDERAMVGKKDMTYPGWQSTSSTGQFGNTRAFPWLASENPPAGWPAFSGATTDIQGTVQKAMMAREIFDPLRWDYSGRYLRGWGDPYFFMNRGSSDITSQEVLVLINKSGSSITYNNVQSLAGASASGTTFRDWFTAVNGGSGRYVANGSGQISGVTVGGNYGAYLIRGSFGLAKLYIRVLDSSGNPLQKAIVSIDGKSSWTRETNDNGYAFINYITTADGGTAQRWVKIWKKGYMIYNEQITFTDGIQTEGNKTLTIDDRIPPATPAGLRAVERAKGVELFWGNNNTESDFESYYVYRTTTPTPPAVGDYIIETLKPMYFDTLFDNGLNIGQTYYYWVRSRDLNDNLSAPSNMIAAVPHKVKVVFQVDMTPAFSAPYSFSNIENMYIKSNTYELGRNDFNSSYKMPDIDPIVEMRHIGNNIYEVSAEMDPTMTVNYLFVCKRKLFSFFSY